MAGLERAPPLGASAEFMATGSRDKQIRIWDGRGNCVKLLVGHDNWVRGLVFHPGGKYLLSVADDRTMRCWDLSQEGKCVQTLTGVYEGFVSCIRWAPPVVKDADAATGPGNGRADGAGPLAAAARRRAATVGTVNASVQIRCVVATGSVDGTEGKVRIFAN